MEAAVNAHDQNTMTRLSEVGLKYLMSETEVSEYTGIPKGTLRVNRSKGTGFRFTKINRSVRYLGEGILATIEANTVPTNAGAMA